MDPTPFNILISNLDAKNSLGIYWVVLPVRENAWNDRLVKVAAAPSFGQTLKLADRFVLRIQNFHLGSIAGILVVEIYIVMSNYAMFRKVKGRKKDQDLKGNHSSLISEHVDVFPSFSQPTLIRTSLSHPPRFGATFKHD